jgi:hypothetical protein
LTRFLVTTSLVTRDLVIRRTSVHHHPALAEALVRDRVTELRQSARTAAHFRPQKRRANGIEAARLGVGWLLIEIGLRLATPRGGMNRPMARGQR